MGNDLTVDFRFGGNGDDHRGTGWADPEGTGTWMLGQQSLLVLPRPETSGDYRLELDLGALTGPGHGSQRLTVGVNGVTVGEFVLVDEGVEHCMLPWSVIGREPGLTLVLSHPDAWRPSELTGGEGDQREISVFVRTVRLSLQVAAPAASPAATAAAPAPVPPARPAPAAAPVAPMPSSPAPSSPAPSSPAPSSPAPSSSAPSGLVAPGPAPVPVPPASTAQMPATPAPAPAVPAAPKPPASTQPAARPAAPLPAPQAAPPSPAPAFRPSPAPAATSPASTSPTAPAQEARLPWWKRLLG